MTLTEGASVLEAVFESALAHRAEPTNTYVSLHEISMRGMIDLRGLNTDKKFMAAAKQVLGIDLPKAPRTSETFGDVKALWLSPDQWMILCARDKAPALTAQLTEALAGIHSLAVDVSDMRAIIRVEGEGAREVMMKGSSLDFTDDDFKPGYVRRIRFAEIAALFNIVEDNVIDLYVFRSYAHYTMDFLTKAARKGSEVAALRK
ncbi:sarcosine oxidase subunit gamma [Aestuariivirga litoralis]|uniref:sarcosine oxidase subunit gamma n=1 Tax=Aestuariivirga litoralis TaxID=2650924 RepID=UPI0018C59BD4|nr:sarcosine oxidase subunit gamma family protein [Aestuariivirga litoralis]MBG1232216.1 sarcosine oxidase subunit gamma [Aestuariivirga litoralis]